MIYDDGPFPKLLQYLQIFLLKIINSISAFQLFIYTLYVILRQRNIKMPSSPFRSLPRIIHAVRGSNSNLGLRLYSAFPRPSNIKVSASLLPFGGLPRPIFIFKKFGIYTVVSPIAYLKPSLVDRRNYGNKCPQRESISKHAFHGHHPQFKVTSCPKFGAVDLQRNTYSNAVLGRCFMRLFPNDTAPNARIKPIQASALKRWHTWHRNIRPKILKQHFSLRHIFQTLDDYYFCRALRPIVRLEWVQDPYQELDWRSQTFLTSNERLGEYAVIQVVKPPAKQYWTNATVQELEAMILYEMLNAGFLLHGCNCCLCLRGNELVRSRLARAMEKVASRSLTGFKRSWQLKGSYSGGATRVQGRQKTGELKCSQRVKNIR